MIGCCQRWSATPMRSKPTSSAACAISARAEANRFGPPSQSKLLSCSPSFTPHLLFRFPVSGARAVRRSCFLLVPQSLGRVDPRGLTGGQVGGQQRRRVSDHDHEQQGAPRHPVLHAGEAFADVVYERAGEAKAKGYPYADAEQGYEGRLYEEGEAHLSTLEA